MGRLIAGAANAASGSGVPAGVVQRTRRDAVAAVKAGSSTPPPDVLAIVRDTALRSKWGLRWRLHLLRLNNEGLAKDHRDHVEPDPLWFLPWSEAELEAELAADLHRQWEFDRSAPPMMAVEAKAPRPSAGVPLETKDVGMIGGGEAKGDVKDDRPGTVTPQGLQAMLRATLRDDMPAATAALGLGDEAALYREAALLAERTYDSVTAGVNAILRSRRASGADVKDAPVLPAASEVRSPGDITERKQRIERDATIPVSGWEMHLAELKRAGAVHDEKAQAERYAAQARARIASGWAEAASAVLALREHKVSAAKPGRDLVGRFAYYLLTVRPQDVGTSLRQHDPKEGALHQTGVSRLALDLDEVFSSAACHSDAAQMVELLSARREAHGEETITHLAGADAFSAAVVSAVGECTDAPRLLKVTDPDHHSVLVLVRENAGVLYETLAGRNTRHLLYDDIVERHPRPKAIGPMLRETVEAFVGAGKNKMSWEVHSVLPVDQVRMRLSSRLGRGATEVSIGLALAGHEASQAGDAPDPRDTKRSTSSAPPRRLVVPLRFLNPPSYLATGAELYLLRDTTRATPEALRANDSYRMRAQQHWMQVRYLGPSEAKALPSWMAPAAEFEIERVSHLCSHPVLRELAPGESLMTVQTLIFNLTLRQGMERSAVIAHLADPTRHGRPIGPYTITYAPPLQADRINASGSEQLIVREGSGSSPGRA